MECVAPPSSLVGEPHPEETIEAPELRAPRLAAKQDELLSQRQIFERKVSAGSERRTQRAQQGEYEGHCLPGWHVAGSSSSLCDRILANDNVTVEVETIDAVDVERHMVTKYSFDVRHVWSS